MKHGILLAAMLATALPRVVTAQGEFEPPPPGPPPGEMHVGGHGPQMVDRWLERLKEKNPQEYDRLTKLRDEDPDAFRKELRTRLQKEQSRAFMDEHPQVREAIMGLPPQERDALMGRLMQPGDGGPEQRPGPGMQHGMPPGGENNPEIQAQQEEMRTLAASFKAATTPEDKEKIKAELKTGLGTMFDLREKQRAQEIEQFDRHIAELKSKLEKRKANRDKIIEKRLQEITGGDELSW